MSLTAGPGSSSSSGRVAFPADGAGARSTSATGRAVVADALRAVDAQAAAAAEAQADWRSGYVQHFVRLVECGLGSRDDARRVASAGLASAHARMVLLDADGHERPLGALHVAAADRALATTTVVGTAEPESGVSLPYGERRLVGPALLEQLQRWVAAGVMEPSAADKVCRVMAHPQWLRLPGQVVAVLSAASEMGPLPALLRWGATVAAVDVPRPALWRQLVETARTSAGTLLVPVGRPGAGVDEAGVDEAGVDLLHEVPAVAEWLRGLDGRLVLGHYLYADGGTHVALSVAADVLAERLRRGRPDLALSFLATPTDAFVVPAEAVEESRARYARRGVGSRLLHAVSAGRLLRPNYADADAPQVCDSLVPVQGPSYALAKRLQRWRATVDRTQGHTVSCHVAPSTRTRSVVTNKALAAAFAGAHRFGVEVFEPDTANTLMALLLVHDLHVDGPEHPHPWQAEADAAVHGGLWRSPYSPRSALYLAALAGTVTARG